MTDPRQARIDALVTPEPQPLTAEDKAAIRAAPSSVDAHAVAPVMRDARIPEATLRQLFLDFTLGRPTRLPQDPVQREIAQKMKDELAAVPAHWSVEIPFELPEGS